VLRGGARGTEQGFAAEEHSHEILRSHLEATRWSRHSTRGPRTSGGTLTSRRTRRG
jgi:hypothetical protein